MCVCVYKCVQVCTGEHAINVQRPEELCDILCHGSNYSFEMLPLAEPAFTSYPSAQGLQKYEITTSFYMAARSLISLAIYPVNASISAEHFQ